MYNAVIRMQPNEPLGGYFPKNANELTLGNVLDIDPPSAADITPLFIAFIYASDCNRSCKIIVDVATFPIAKRLAAFDRVYSLIAYTFTVIEKTRYYSIPIEIKEALSSNDLIKRGYVEFTLFPMKVTIH